MRNSTSKVGDKIVVMASDLLVNESGKSESLYGVIDIKIQLPQFIYHKSNNKLSNMKNKLLCVLLIFSTSHFLFAKKTINESTFSKRMVARFTKDVSLNESQKDCIEQFSRMCASQLNKSATEQEMTENYKMLYLKIDSLMTEEQKTESRFNRRARLQKKFKANN